MRIVVGFPAGGGIDILAPDGTMALGAAWPAIWHRQQAGWRAANIGTEAVVRAQRIDQENAAALLQRSY